ncbi:MAG: hypothetical protein ACPG5P_02545 [Saprospiraceae bacterium]
MRNKFIQKIHGECFLVCLANWFDDDWFIRSHNADLSKGISLLQGKRIVDFYSEGEIRLTTILLSRTPIDTYLPFFEDPADFSGELKDYEDYYLPFFVTIPSDGHGHEILVIKELYNKGVTVLDPYFKEGKKMGAKKFFETYKPLQIETLCNTNNEQSLFSSKHVAHLMN